MKTKTSTRHSNGAEADQPPLLTFYHLPLRDLSISLAKRLHANPAFVQEALEQIALERGQRHKMRLKSNGKV